MINFFPIRLDEIILESCLNLFNSIEIVASLYRKVNIFVNTSGYDGSVTDWEDYSRSVNHDGIEVPPHVSCIKSLCSFESLF